MMNTIQYKCHSFKLPTVHIHPHKRTDCVQLGWTVLREVKVSNHITMISAKITCRMY